MYVQQATQLYFPEAVESAEFVRGEGGGLELVVSARGQPHLTYVDVETLQQRRVRRATIHVHSWGHINIRLLCNTTRLI